MEQNAGQAEARINNLVLLYKFQFGYHKSDSYASILSRSREWSISLRVSVILRVFAPAVDPPYYGVFGGKCTTVFGAINMLNAFARVEAALCLLPLAKFAMRDPEWVRRRREKRQRGGKREGQKARKREREASGDKSGSGGRWKREGSEGDKRSESDEEGDEDERP